MAVQDENQKKEADGHHLDKDDLKRAEKHTGMKAPLTANEDDAFVTDTELDNPSEAAKASAKINDPTAGGGTEH